MPKTSKTAEKRLFSSLSRWFVILLFGFAFLLRFWQFGEVPVSLYWDEMAIWDDARSILETGRDMHGRSALQAIFISYGDYKMPVYIWLVSLVARFVPDPALAVRLPSALAGISMIIGVGILAYRLWRDKTLAVLAALVMAFLPWSLHFSRVGFEAHLASAFVLWSVVSFFLLRDEKNSRSRAIWAVLVVMLGSASFYTYFSARFVWPVVIVAASLLWWPLYRERLRWVIGIVVVWSFSLLPMLQADFYAESDRLRLSSPSILNDPELPDRINEYRRDDGNTWFSRVLYNRPIFLLRAFSLQMLEFLSPRFLFLRGDDNWRHGLGLSGLMWVGLAPAFLTGVFTLLREQWRVWLFLCIWWSVSILPAAVPLEVPHALRSLNGLPALVLFITFGLWWLWQKFPVRARLLLGIGIGAILLFEVFRYTHYLFVVYPSRSADAWQDGYHQLAEYLQAHRDEFDRVVVDDFDDRFFLYYLPYSGYSWQEIQEIPSEGFRRQELGSVDIMAFENASLESEENILFISRGDKVPESASVRARIFGKGGELAFVAWQY